MNIAELVKEGPGQTLELLGELTSRTELAKTICSFSNGSGGLILMGAEPKTGKLIGLSFNAIYDLHEAFKKLVWDLVEPVPSLQAKVMVHNARKVFAVSVLPGNLKPYYLKGRDKYTGAYIRMGSNNVLANASLVAELDRIAQNINFDTTATFDAEVDDLDVDMINGYLYVSERKALVNYAFLENNKFIIRDTGKIYPTVSGILCFSSRVNDFFPHAKVKCGKYSGKNQKELDSIIIDGPLISQIGRIVDFFEDTDVSRDVVKELSLNAIMHRDYSVTTEITNISLYDDRFEVKSPGFLPIGISINNLAEGICVYRNQNVYRIFHDMGFSYTNGTGLQNVNKLLTEANLHKVQFSCSDNYLIASVLLEPQEEFLSKDEQKILEFLEINDYITNIQCQKLLKVKGKQAQYILTKLVKRSKLSCIGDKKGRKYLLNKTGD